MKLKKPLPLFIISLLIIVVLWTWKTVEHPFSDVNVNFMPKPVRNNIKKPTPVAMYVEENAIVVNTQKSGNTVLIDKVLIAMEGYVVIHEDADGKPGEIIGSSKLLSKGEHMGVEVALERDSVQGETLHAMLHSEMGSVNYFESNIDKPILSKKMNAPITATFNVDDMGMDTQPSVEMP